MDILEYILDFYLEFISLLSKNYKWFEVTECPSIIATLLFTNKRSSIIYCAAIDPWQRREEYKATKNLY